MSIVPDRGGLVTVLTISLLLVPMMAGLGDPAIATGSSGMFVAQTGVDPDTVSLQLTLRSGGSASWRIDYRMVLEDENASAAFDSLQTAIRENRSAYVDRFTDRLTRTAAAAENTTGRAMAIRNVSVQTSRQTIGKRYGVVTYTFEWTGFAAVDGDRLVVDRTLAGFFLDADTTLQIRWPSDYRATSVSPSPTERLDNGVLWAGRLDFGQAGPQLVITSAPPTETTTDGDSPTPATGTSGGLSPTTLGVAALLALVIVGAGRWYYTRRSTDQDDGGSSAAVASGDSDDGGDETTAEPSDDQSSAPPSDLLSNEERVLRLLEANGGRMKQQQVAEELDWTDAKTSQVVSDLRDNDELESFRLGRENVLSLPDEDDI